MKQRILTGLPVALAAVYLIVQEREWLFVLAVLVTVEISLHEFFYVSRQAGLKNWPLLGYLGGGLLCLSQFADLRRTSFSESLGLLLVVLGIPTLGLALVSNLKDYLSSVASTLLGVFYVAFTFSWLVPLRFSEPAEGRNLVLLLFAIVWGEDIFAYTVGRLAGKIPLAERISPRKTVEGAVAGLVGAILIAWGFGHVFWQTGDQKTVILVAGLVAVAGQVGDLVESGLKRAANLKDSGAILPGHGGMLDRIDSLLFAVPTLWLVWNLKDLWWR
ncbi:MAG: phosphatidate cytidylyltransferase [Acidobacteria bacterium]|nr:phosphatidate cytidylyltransferase [Acidobacteriota bacterium]